MRWCGAESTRVPYRAKEDPERPVERQLRERDLAVGRAAPFCTGALDDERVPAEPGRVERIGQHRGALGRRVDNDDFRQGDSALREASEEGPELREVRVQLAVVAGADPSVTRPFEPERAEAYETASTAKTSAGCTCSNLDDDDQIGRLADRRSS
jgi:hypothetical protein